MGYDVYHLDQNTGVNIYSHSVFVSALDQMMQGCVSSPSTLPTGAGSGMFAGGPLKPGPSGSTYRYDMGEQPKPDMHIYHNGNPKGPETNIDHEGKVRTGTHHGQELKGLPKKLKAPYRSIIKTFLERAGVAGELLEDVLEGIVGDVPIIYIDTRHANQYGNTHYGSVGA